MAPQRSMPCRMKVFRSRITNPQKSTNANRSPDLRNFVVSQSLQYLYRKKGVRMIDMPGLVIINEVAILHISGRVVLNTIGAYHVK